ncbi:unnamed protein product [Pieris macdunnoughi]|uniref:Uncharacterized protein n=1 Tax=Pieris macdunnoughi TaxID=345717 RepID=A0A821KVL0_9NEOP|nr:unnamed protein product [Pieris macdunnoughi]
MSRASQKKPSPKQASPGIVGVHARYSTSDNPACLPPVLLDTYEVILTNHHNQLPSKELPNQFESLPKATTHS